MHDLKFFYFKKDFFFSFLLIVGFSLFIFLPFFVYTPLVQLSMDSFDYSYLAKLIFDKKVPAENLKIDLPIGYPLVIFLIKFLGLNFNHLVVFQLLFYVISFVFLCFQFSKFSKYGGIIIVLSFLFYSLNSYTIRHVFKISTDSLYTSSLVFLVGGLFFYFRTRNRLSLIVVLSCISVAVLLRSNGIYLFFLIPFFMYFEITHKKNLKFILVSLISLFVIISSLNYKVKGVFAPFDKNRLIKVVNVMSNNNYSYNSQFPKKITKKPTKRKKIFLSYFKCFFEKHPSYYYSIQKTNYNSIIKNNTFYNEDQPFFGSYSIKEMDSSLLSFMFNGIKETDYSSLMQHVFFETGKNNFWLYSIYAVQELIYLLRINLIIYILFLFFSAILVVNLFKDNKFDLILFPLIHLVSLFLLPFIHGRFIYRYLQVSEFVIYIVVLGFIISLNSKFKTIVK